MNYDKIFINGQWVNPSSSDRIKVENPANKNIIGSVPACKAEDVDLAVLAAKEALKTWQFTSLTQRINLMEKLIEELRNREDEMVDIIVQELGAPKDFARNSHIRRYLKGMDHLIEVIQEYPLQEKHDHFIVSKEAVGVVGALTPWNYPFGQITKKLAPALLSGSTMILKPSQKTPLIAYFLTEAIEKVGFPKGVFNLVPGRGADVGNPLARHPGVNLLTFTGSTKGGQEVSKLASEDIKRVVLELGGKSPAIVLEDGDLKSAVSIVLDDIYRNTGQSCNALSRLIIPVSKKEEIQQMIIEASKNYKFGDPQDPDTMIGPLASKQQFDKVKGYIETGLKEGAKMLLGEIPKESEGYFVNPVVFTDVTNDMVIAREEIFGPVLCIITYETVDEAIEIANDTNYGLSSAVFGPEKDALEIASKIKAGQVRINDAPGSYQAPFGGYKHSGVGREGGKYGLEAFLEIKALLI